MTKSEQAGYGKIQIEVCVDSVQSAENAIAGGADRLELCGSLGLGGGVTPSLGLLKAIQSRWNSIPIMVMIRPRPGDFLFSENELQVMIEDIRIFKEQNVHGVVLGALKTDGTVDINVTRMLVNEALPLQVTFHRAFDMCRNLQEAYRDVRRLGGVTRILTSGHGKTVSDSLDSLQYLLEQTSNDSGSSDKLSILPGSGVNVRSISSVLDALIPVGLEEVHLSGGSWVDNGRMTYRPEGMGMGVGGDGEWGIWETKEEKVREVKEAIDAFLSWRSDSDS